MHQTIEAQAEPALFSENRRVEDNEHEEPQTEEETKTKDHFAISLNYVMITNLHLQFTMIILCCCCIWQFPYLLVLCYTIIPDGLAIKSKLIQILTSRNCTANTRKLLMLKMLDSVSTLIFKVLPLLNFLGCFLLVPY